MAETKKKSDYSGTITGINNRDGMRAHAKAFAFVELDEESAARLRSNDNVTFTIVPSVWKGDFEPQAGLRVMLSKLVAFDTGWRAMSARPITPEDGEEMI